MDLLIGFAWCAFAGEVFVDGKVVSGVQTFDNVDVQVRSNGDVLIETAPPRWWLVIEGEGARGHSFSIEMRGAEIWKGKSEDTPVRVFLDPWLQAGENTLQVNATSTGASGGELRVWIGQGRLRGETLVMEGGEAPLRMGPDRQGQWSEIRRIQFSR